jgi:hypothetical protein
MSSLKLKQNSAPQQHESLGTIRPGESDQTMMEQVGRGMLVLRKRLVMRISCGDEGLYQGTSFA